MFASKVVAFPHYEAYPSVKGAQHSVSVRYLDRVGPSTIVVSCKAKISTLYELTSSPSCSSLILDARLRQFCVAN